MKIEAFWQFMAWASLIAALLAGIASEQLSDPLLIAKWRFASIFIVLIAIFLRKGN